MATRNRFKLSVVMAGLFSFALMPGSDAESYRTDGAEAVRVAASSTGQDEAANGCLSCHQKSGDRSVELFGRSTHAAAKITCTACHGGDPFTMDKQTAHTGRFVGQPRSDQLLNICGSCHRPQLEMFKAGRHFPESSRQARVDCVQCHGAHTVGAPSESFSFAYLCAGCHGLEYLPELPADFKKMMALADDIQDSLRAARESGQQLSDQAASLRKEIRRHISEIVHPTDLQGGAAKIPAILKLGQEFKQTVDRQKK
ncbi:MAG TPA: cytochrome c3 family protein [Blastocatellia bacterium]|nr:cytochrome c3 family protein [Blastocatellia bacterium]